MKQKADHYRLEVDSKRDHLWVETLHRCGQESNRCCNICIAGGYLRARGELMGKLKAFLQNDSILRHL